MASFKDHAGRAWQIDLDIITADEIKAAHGVDLIDPDKMSETFIKLAGGSTRLLVAVCYQLVHPQAEKAGVAPEDFGRAMKPQAVADAYCALRDAISDFFRPLNPAAADAILHTWAAAEQVAADMGREAVAKIDRHLASLVAGIQSADSAASTPELLETSAV